MSVFISYNSRDLEVAQKVKQRLKDEGFENIFLGFDPEHGFGAGEVWEKSLYQELDACRAVIVICSPHSMGVVKRDDGAGEEKRVGGSMWVFAEITHARAGGKLLIPLLAEPCQPFETLLMDRQAIDLREKEQAWQRLFSSLRAKLLPQDVFEWKRAEDGSFQNPYPGLSRFEEEHAAVFFGREQDVVECTEKLYSMAAQGTPRLAVVSGDSGSGKSSLVRAGVIPRLEKESEGWLALPPFTPGRNPLGSLASALYEAYKEAERPEDEILDEFENGSYGELWENFQRRAHKLANFRGRRNAKILVFIDQFEELLPVPGNGGHPDSQAERFLDFLKKACAETSGRIFFVAALHSDFLGQMEKLGFRKAERAGPGEISFREWKLEALTEWEEVIRKPAGRIPGLKFENDRLVERMTEDAKVTQSLPRMAFLLHRMFEDGKGERMTFDSYKSPGGVDAAAGLDVVAGRAEEALSELDPALSPIEEDGLRAAFLKMARFDKDKKLTRRKADWDALPKAAHRPLEALVKKELLLRWPPHAADEDNRPVSLEVTYEKLFTSWKRLSQWLDEEKEFLGWRDGFEAAWKRWEKSGRDDSSLLRGKALKEAEEQAPKLTGPQREFVRLSARRREKEQRQRLLVAAVAVISLVLFGFAFVVSQQNRRTARLLEAVDLRSQAASLLEGRRERADQALGLATVSMSQLLDDGFLEETPRQQTLRDALAAPVRFRTPLISAKKWIRGMDASAEKPYLLVVDGPGVWLWEWPSSRGDEPRLLHSFDHEVLGTHSLTTAVFAKGPSEAAGGVFVVSLTNIATPGNPPTSQAHLWSWLDGKGQLERSFDLGFRATHLDVSEDGQTLAAGGGTAVGVWKLSDGQRIFHEEKLQARVSGVQLAPTDAKLATAVDDEIQIWDYATGRRIDSLEHSDRIHALDISADGKWLAAAGGDTVGLWDFATYDRVGRLVHRFEERGRISKGDVLAVSFSSDGRRLASASGESALLWDLVTRQQLAVMPHGSGVRSLSFQPGGRLLATGELGHRLESGETAPVVWVWDIQPPEPAIRLSHSGVLDDFAFSPDGKLLAAALVSDWGSQFASVETWPLEAERPPTAKILNDHEGAVHALAYDAATLVVAGPDSQKPQAPRVTQWDPSGSPVVKPPLDHPKSFDNLVLSGDGKLMAVSSDSPARITVWRVQDSAEEASWTSEHPISALAFSADGQWLAAGERQGEKSGSVTLWDFANSRSLTSFRIGHSEGEESYVPMCLSFSKDGRLLAVSSPSDLHVTMWNPRTGDLMHDLDHADGVLDQAFSPDGLHLATVSFDGSILVWNVSEERVEARFTVPDAGRVAFKPDDGDILATSDSRGYIQVFRWRSEDLIETACRRLGSDFAGLADGLADVCRQAPGR